MMRLQLKTMEERAQEMLNAGSPIIVWGTGEKARGTLPLLKNSGIIPECFCDSDKRKYGTEFEHENGSGKILSPEECKKRFPYAAYVICTEIGNYNQIIKNFNHDRYFHCNYPFKVEPKMLDIGERLNELEAMGDELADELSKEVFNAAVNYKLNGDIIPLVGKTDGKTMFDPVLLKRFRPDETYIDCGAYTGDTMIHFLEFCQGNYGKIILFDGDSNNCAWMKKLAENTRLANVEVYDQLLWHQKEELEFYTFDVQSDDLVYENADVSELRRDNACSRKLDKLNALGAYKPVRCMADRLDAVIAANENVGLIKISVVGSDMNVLRGCERLMKKKKPAVVIEWAGCKENDVWEMIPFIRSCRSDYKIYLRQKQQWQGSKTILYAV